MGRGGRFALPLAAAGLLLFGSVAVVDAVTARHLGVVSAVAWWIAVPSGVYLTARLLLGVVRATG